MTGESERGLQETVRTRGKRLESMDETEGCGEQRTVGEGVEARWRDGMDARGYVRSSGDEETRELSPELPSARAMSAHGLLRVTAATAASSLSRRLCVEGGRWPGRRWPGG